MWTIYAVGYPDCPVVTGVDAPSLAEAVRAIVGEWVPVDPDGTHSLPLTVYGPGSVDVLVVDVIVTGDVVVEVL